MSDIVERLRRVACEIESLDFSADAPDVLMIEAATEIASLREKLDWCEDMGKAPRDGTPLILDDANLQDVTVVASWEDGGSPHNWYALDQNYHRDMFNRWRYLNPPSRGSERKDE